MEKTKKNDFVEIKFTGFANGEAFDSNIEEDLKKINPKATPENTLVIIGQGAIVTGLDKALEGKELGKEYEVSVPYKEGFGERRRDLIRTLPIKGFLEQKINPQVGMVLALDQNIVKIIAVSGSRVTADFNNPLAGKDLKYKFTISRFVTEDKEKAETSLKMLFQFIPEFEIKDKKVAVKFPKGLESMIDMYKEKFKELTGMELIFEEKKQEKRETKKEDKNEEEKVKEKTDSQ